MTRHERLKQAQKEAKGLGDTIAALIEATGLDKLVRDKQGRICAGCQRRKATVNRLFPYKN